MLERYRRAINYWMFAVSHPGYVLQFAQRDLHRVRIGFYITLTFSLLHSFASLALWSSGRLPLIETWIPYVSAGEFFLFQALWSPLWFVTAWVAIAGFIYLFTCLAGKEAYFEDSLLISALSISIPYLMFWWIPETFLLPAMGPGTLLKWPELFELERKFFFPGIWQVALITYGMRKVNNTNRLACLTAALLSVSVFFILYLPFLR